MQHPNTRTEYRQVGGHVEVWQDGHFLCSADTREEARKEAEAQGAPASPCCRPKAGEVAL